MKTSLLVYSALAAVCLTAAAPQTQDPRKERLRIALKDVQPVGDWIYDDMKRGFAVAKKTKKPLMVVFR